jgi:hypothetical protein
VDRRRLIAIPTFASCAIPWLVTVGRLDTVAGILGGPLLWLGQTGGGRWFPVVVAVGTLALVSASVLRPHVAWVFGLIPAFCFWILSGIAWKYAH